MAALASRAAQLDIPGRHFFSCRLPTEGGGGGGGGGAGTGRVRWVAHAVAAAGSHGGARSRGGMGGRSAEGAGELGCSKSVLFAGQALQLHLRSRSLPQGPGRGSGRLVVQAAVFDQLSTSLEQVWKKLSAETTLTKDNIKEPMAEIRRALLEADVSLPVVRRFVKSVAEKAVGTGVVKGVTPDQQLVKVVNDELVELMGGKVAELESATSGPTVILLAGLQGVGKTTACGKLAQYLKKKGKSVLMVATDIYRPAAIEQLITLGKQVEVPVFSLGQDVSPPEIARRGLDEAEKKKADVVLVDTAGRLQIDATMMAELKAIKETVRPTETLLVVDAMTGQEAAGLVAAFNTEVGITGAILTKVDGDSRGGAALSVKEVSGKPIKFVGEGEGMDSLVPFYPDRMASRILGRGDIVSFVEKAQETMAEEDAAAMAKKMAEAKFDFEDLVKQTKMMARMGSFAGMAKYIPGMNKITPQQMRDAEKSVQLMESMINCMTPEERKAPELLAESPSRRRRIATDSGRTQEQVASLVSQLFAMRAQMKQMMQMASGMPGMPNMGEMGGPLKASSGKAKRKKKKASLMEEMGEFVTASGENVGAAVGSGKSRGFGSKQ